MMCDDVVLSLTDAPPSDEVTLHLEQCMSCREAAQVIGWATLPKVSVAERVALNDLPRRVIDQAHQDARRSRSLWRQVAQLAMAASLGAVVASAALLSRAPVAPERVVLEVPVEVPALPEPDEPNLSDDEVFFEMSWPDENSN